MKLSTTVLLLALAGCASNYPLSLENMQAAFMKKAIAECEYETDGQSAERYEQCMRAKGAR
jgi:hypothetical protein